MDTQHTHYTLNNQFKKFPIHVIGDGLSSPANIGGLCRLMDSFGLKDLWLCNADIDLNSSRLKRTARATQDQLNIKTELLLEPAIANLKLANTHIIALELTAKSKPLSELVIPKNTPLALILGGEQHGISEFGLTQARATYHIPMYGNNSSMNVIQAASIGLYAITQKLL